MKKIAVCIEKGGVGKTTIAVNLAHCLSFYPRKGKDDVLLIDLDPQGNCSWGLGLESGKGLSDIIMGEEPRKCIIKARPNLYLLPPGESLHLIKSDLKEYARNWNVMPDKFLGKVLSFLNDYNFDFIVVDSPPGRDLFLENILDYADEIVVPLLLDYHSIISLLHFSETVLQAGKKISYIVPNAYLPQVSISHQIYSYLRKNLQTTLSQPIAQSVKLRECFGQGQTIFEYHSRDKSIDSFIYLGKKIKAGT